MEELKQQALDLGLEFKGNISKSDLIDLIENAKKQTADGSVSKTVKVIITPRDPEEKEGYVGLNGYTAQFQFDVELDMPRDVVEFLKTIGGYTYKANGTKKWQSRYIVEVL